MSLRNHRIITFDVVGTLIDFETGILNYIQAIAKRGGLTLSAQQILEAYAVAEDHQHHLTPDLPFPSMLAPMYIEMAEKLGLPAGNGEAEGFRLSIPQWPAFPDSFGPFSPPNSVSDTSVSMSSTAWARSSATAWMVVRSLARLMAT